MRSIAALDRQLATVDPGSTFPCTQQELTSMHQSGFVTWKCDDKKEPPGLCPYVDNIKLELQK